MRTKFILISFVFFNIIFLSNAKAATIGNMNAQPSNISTQQQQTPQNATDCASVGGKWGKAGIFPKEFCNLPTKDANKICNDASECEGTCLAMSLTREQVEQTWRQKIPIRTSGKCTAWKLVFGCMPVVRNGKVQGLFCQD